MLELRNRRAKEVAQHFNSLPNSQGLFQNNKAVLMNVFSQTDGGLMLTFPGNCSFSQNPSQSLHFSTRTQWLFIVCQKGEHIVILMDSLRRLFSRSQTVNEKNTVHGCV